MKPSPGAFVPRLEALRGLAALSVAALHSGQAQFAGAGCDPCRLVQGPQAGADPGWLAEFAAFAYRVLAQGHAGVLLFFVLSGFVLRLSLEHSFDTVSGTSVRFLLRRAARLFPAIAAMTLLFAVWKMVFGLTLPGLQDIHFEPVNLVLNAFVMGTAINGVVWTIRVEIIGSVLVLLCFLAARKWGDMPLIALFVLLAAASFSKDLGWLASPVPGPGGVLYAFVAGMLACSIGRQLAPRLTSSMQTWIGSAAALAFLAVAPLTGWWNAWTYVLQAVAAAVLISALAYGGTGGAFRLLDVRSIRFLGLISYSFYLLHPLALTVIWNIPDTLGDVVAYGVPNAAVALVLFAVTAALTIPLAWLSFRFVERPGIYLGAYLARGMRTGHLKPV